ncbi:hypothetical protein [uncultured Methanobrevibacter sp.]|uniref:hypothetical protein n=1 Tax=uncultured Methanobrevibacter sp. TaxID=253161 RepID=UPI0025D48334|nr:hypothetical protein [uncultured Methanobrevibacter sp.]
MLASADFLSGLVYTAKRLNSSFTFTSMKYLRSSSSKSNGSSFTSSFANILRPLNLTSPTQK